MNTGVIITSEIVSAGLALALVFYSYKAFRVTRSSYLFGLPAGFLFLSSSYFLLGLVLLYENNVTASELFLWLRLITQTYGFAFLSLCYYFSSKPDKENPGCRSFFRLVLFASIISILLLLGALMFTPSLLSSISTDVAGVYFRMGNLSFLGFIIYHLVRRMESRHEVIGDLILTCFAFVLFWLEQYSLLIWGLDGSGTAFLAAHGARLTALMLFIYIYYSSREGNKRETRKAK